MMPLTVFWQTRPSSQLRYTQPYGSLPGIRVLVLVGVQMKYSSEEQ
jgi:hypothetical protein